jgi:isoleucyl-tRNA synthetase
LEKIWVLISKEIQGFSKEQISQLDKEGSLNVVIAEITYFNTRRCRITSQDIEGWLVPNGITVALDITISSELKQEGLPEN